MTAKCRICLGEMSNPILIIDCNHDYCHDCIKHWLTISEECPYCKSPVSQLLTAKPDNTIVVHTVAEFKGKAAPALTGKYAVKRTFSSER